MTTPRRTTMAQVSATTPKCQDTATLRSASRQVRKSPTTCHNLIKAQQHGTRWMTLIMTQTQTPMRRKLPISWRCEARRRGGLSFFFELLFLPVAVHCIPHDHLYTTNHLLLLQYANTYCSSTNHSADLRNIQYYVHLTVVLTTILVGKALKLGPTTFFVVIQSVVSDDFRTQNQHQRTSYSVCESLLIQANKDKPHPEVHSVDVEANNVGKVESENPRNRIHVTRRSTAGGHCLATNFHPEFAFTVLMLG